MGRELHAKLTGGASFSLGGGEDDPQAPGLRADLRRACRTGQLTIEPVPSVDTRVREMLVPEPLGPPPAPAPAPATEASPVHFELSLVDEFGEPLSGATAGILFRHDGAEQVQPADGQGTARLDKPNGTSFAWARLADAGAVDAVQAAVRSLWDQPVRVQERTSEVITEEDDRTSIVFFRSAPPTPPGGAARPSPLLGRDFPLAADEPHRVSVQPYVERARLRGFYFDTNKCFLLPSAVPDLGAILEAYDRNPGAALLIVGHTDTSGEDAYNEELSLERADSLAAYLQDQVDAWMPWYGTDKPTVKRWGAREDGQMIDSLKRRGLNPGSQPALSYQIWHNNLAADQRAANWEQLADDGIIGSKTRAQLIGDYMRHDRTTLPGDVSVTTHGCGEYFPLDDTLENLDPNPANPDRDQTDRRVEIFFFDGALGIQPPPPGPTSKRGSPEYPEWRSRESKTHEFTPGTRQFIEIVLEDDKGNRVPGEAFEVRFSDGSSRTGQLGPDGTAHLTGIPRGTCHVAFPAIDQPGCELVASDVI